MPRRATEELLAQLIKFLAQLINFWRDQESFGAETNSVVRFSMAVKLSKFMIAAGSIIVVSASLLTLI
jgi:hypothetical protein